MKSNFIIPIFIPGLGCPYCCSYCNQSRITGQQKQPTAEDVTKIIGQYLETIPRGEGIHIEAAFYGGSFTVLPARLQKELLEPAFEFRKQGMLDEIRISTRPDYISESILEQLQLLGVSVIELGVQSLDQRVLERSRRGYQAGAVAEAVTLIKQYDFKLGLQLMIGLPGDSCDLDMDTARKVIALKPDFVRIYPTLVVDNTELADQYASGDYRPLDLEEAVDISALMLTMFRGNGIPVIRIGLQPTDEINEQGIIAGPFHPAFRELAEARIYRWLLQKAIADCLKITGPDSKQTRLFEIAYTEKDQSMVHGQKKSNILFLKQNWPRLDVRLTAVHELPRGQLLLISCDGRQIGRVYTAADIDMAEIVR